MKRMCSDCGKHPATFRHHGKVKVDVDHDLCMRCFVSQRDRMRMGESYFFMRYSAKAAVVSIYP